MEFGKLRKYRNGQWFIDLGRTVTPRRLYSARGADFADKATAGSVLSAIRVKIARGTSPQQAVDEFSPEASAAHNVERWVDDYLAEQTERAGRLEISPNHLRELRRCARDKGYWSWWHGWSIHEIDAPALTKFRRYLARNLDLSPKTQRNILGYFRSFMKWMHALEAIDRIPAFPTVKVKDHRPTIISPRTQELILEEIPYERRGAFIAACYGIRPGEVRALDIADADERGGVPGLPIDRAVKGPNANAPVGQAMPLGSRSLMSWLSGSCGAWRSKKSSPQTTLVGVHRHCAPTPLLEGPGVAG